MEDNQEIIDVLKKHNIEVVSMSFIDYKDFTDKFIIDTIKRNQFVEIIKSGQIFWLKGFTLLEITKDKKTNHIVRILMRHDIDNKIEAAKSVEIKNKVSDLQLFINYFDKI